MILSEQNNVNIPCGGLDPPYTYTKSGAVVLIERSNKFYTISKLKRTDNGDGYCCHAMGDTVCYHLNITCMLDRQYQVGWFKLKYLCN